MYQFAGIDDDHYRHYLFLQGIIGKGSIMISIDLTTVMIGFVFGNLICFILLFSQWRNNRTHYPGLGWWTAGFFANLIGIILLTGRDHLPEFFSMLLGSLFMVSGILLLYVGVNRFLINKGLPRHLLFLVVVYIALQTYFIYIQPDFRIRNILFSTAMFFFSLQFVWLYFRQIKVEDRPIARNLVIVTSLFGVMALARVLLNILVSPGTGPSHSSSYEAFAYLVFQMLYIVLTLTLFALVNRRLYNDLERDIAERKKVESALQKSEEKYFKAFQSSPDAGMITRIEDGKIIEVNDAFLKTIGYERDEAINQTTLALGIWVDTSDRERLVEDMRKKSVIRNAQFQIKTRNGLIIQVDFSADYIRIGDEDCMLSVIRDVSERKQIEDIIRLRLTLWDYSILHSPIEVMQKALDEIEKSTGSQISFFHLVNDDNATLTLQAWSTNTKNTYCKAEGSGMHYPLEQAGVWADCIRERRPIIHNDYAALTNKKGMPEGHARLDRELVVPIIQDDRVVSVLGVGNKPINYDEKDAKLLEYLASLVWSIVSKMRADAQIRELNQQLEEMAMSDELTDLANRRYFILRGNEEIIRSRRYRASLSLIMLDLDKFKTINDTFGHDTGDQALQCVAKTLKAQCREVDIPARLGGEEFGILLPNTQLEEAVNVAERIRRAIEELHCMHEGKTVAMTASLGVASTKPGMKVLDELFHHADTAMYQAKNAGRNRVVLYE